MAIYWGSPIVSYHPFFWRCSMKSLGVPWKLQWKIAPQWTSRAWTQICNEDTWHSKGFSYHKFNKDFDIL